MDEKEKRGMKNPQHGGTQQNKQEGAHADCRRTRGYKDGFESHTAV